MDKEPIVVSVIETEQKYSLYSKQLIYGLYSGGKKERQDNNKY